MSFMMAVKVFCDLSLYASVVVAIAPWFAAINSLFPPAILCAVGVGLAAALSGRGALRYLGLLGAAAAYAISASLADAIVVTPMAVYTLFLIRKNRFSLDYGPYYDFFVSGLKFLGLGIIFATIAMDWLAMLPYACVYLVGGVFLLRQLRLGVTGSWKDKVLNALTLAGVVALGGGICLMFWLIFQLRFPATDLVEWILTYVMYGIELLVILGDRISMWLRRILPEGFPFGDHTESPDLNLPEYEVQVGEEVLPNGIVRSIVGVAFFILAIVAVILLIGKMVRMLRRGHAAGSRPVYTEAIGLGGRKKREKFGSNRAKIRTYYRRFLQLIHERGITVHPSHTSADVLHSSALVTDAEASLSLREVYIAARYDEKNEVTGEQVKKAKALYNKLKEK